MKDDFFFKSGNKEDNSIFIRSYSVLIGIIRHVYIVIYGYVKIVYYENPAYLLFIDNISTSVRIQTFKTTKL